MDISVIIPARNMADTLAGAVESAFVAGATSVLVYDDDSHDDTRAVVGHLQQRYAGLLCYGGREQRLGVCGARNYCISRATTGLIVPLDADDRLLPDGLLHLLAAWRPGAVVYGGWIEAGREYMPPPSEMLDRKHIGHATLLYSRAQWVQVGGYDPDFAIGGEDWQFLRQLRRCATLVAVHAPVYERGGDHTRTTQARARAPWIAQLMREKDAQQTHT